MFISVSPSPLLMDGNQEMAFPRGELRTSLVDFGPFIDRCLHIARIMLSSQSHAPVRPRVRFQGLWP